MDKKKTSSEQLPQLELELTKLFILTYLGKELWKECIVLNKPEINVVANMLTEEIILKLNCRFSTHGEGLSVGSSSSSNLNLNTEKISTNVPAILRCQIM